MKIKRIVSLILAALMMASLCVFVMGCAPSTEQKNELEEAKQARLEMLDKKYKEVESSLYNTYCGPDKVHNEIDYYGYHAMCNYYEKIFAAEKEKTEKIENLDEMPDYRFFSDIERILLYHNGFTNTGFFPQSLLFSIKSETDDGITYEIKSDYLFLSSRNVFYIQLDSVDEELSIDFKVKILTPDGEKEEYNFADKTKRRFYFEYSEYPTSSAMTIKMVIRKDDEILGYTLISGIDFGYLNVLKSATIKSECRNVVTDDKVAEYMDSEDVEAEKRDGIKLIASEVENRINWYDSSVGAEIAYANAKDAAGKYYNQVKIIKNKKVLGRIYECWADDGAIDINGEQAERVVLDKEQTDEIKWEIPVEGDGYLNIVRKLTGIYNTDVVNNSIILLKAKKLDEEVYEGNVFMPEVHVACGLAGMFYIDLSNREYEELIFGDESFAAYIEGMKKYEYQRWL